MAVDTSAAELRLAMEALITLAGVGLKRFDATRAAADLGEAAALSGIASAFGQLAEHFEYLAERGISLRSPRPADRSDP